MDCIVKSGGKTENPRRISALCCGNPRSFTQVNSLGLSSHALNCLCLAPFYFAWYKLVYKQRIRFVFLRRVYVSSWSRTHEYAPCDESALSSNYSRLAPFYFAWYKLVGSHGESTAHFSVVLWQPSVIYAK